MEIVIKNKPEKTCLEKGTFPVEGTQNAEVEKPSLGAKLLGTDVQNIRKPSQIQQNRNCYL